MDNHLDTSINSCVSNQHEDNAFLQESRNDQLARVYKSFYESPKTMLEVDVECGVRRAYVCWYCRHLRKSNQLFMVGKRLCKISKHMATVWTTNPELVPIDPQMKMF